MIFDAWDRASQQVPFPYLYHWIAKPSKATAALLADLGTIHFVFRITNEFTAHLTLADGAFGAAGLQKESLGFQFMPIQGHQGLLSPEEAARALERQLSSVPGKPAAQKPPRKWASLRLAQPFRAGIMEPRYYFREPNTDQEHAVGARTGAVTLARPAAP